MSGVTSPTHARQTLISVCGNMRWWTSPRPASESGKQKMWRPLACVMLRSVTMSVLTSTGQSEVSTGQQWPIRGRGYVIMSWEADGVTREREDIWGLSLISPISQSQQQQHLTTATTRDSCDKQEIRNILNFSDDWRVWSLLLCIRRIFVIRRMISFRKLTGEDLSKEKTLSNPRYEWTISAFLWNNHDKWIQLSIFILHLDLTLQLFLQGTKQIFV